MTSSDQHMDSWASGIPAPIGALRDLAYDMTWVWTPGTQALFEQVDAELWKLSKRNPVRVLASAQPARLQELAKDAAFVDAVKRQDAARRTGPNAGAWYKSQADKQTKDWRPFLAAYFCAEFGLTECFQIYSGGLGLLAGDHVRSAAQLGLPLVGVGLLYRNGYFHQSLDGNGFQHELFPPVDAPHQPVRRVLDASGKNQLKVRVDLPGRELTVAVWRSDIGGVRLYLLDTNLDENAPLDRDITANLYLGDQTRRIEQEIVLGIAGIRALDAAGEKPSVYHMNEGHAAFMALERIRQFRLNDPSLTFDEAREAASPSHVFTTHTPVPAGIDRFHPGLVSRYLTGYHESLGLDMEGTLALGREDVANRAEAFSMAVLAIRTSGYANGVSRLHGAVSRKMWQNIWPGVSESEVPIGHVTNGIHTDFWVCPRVSALFDRHLGPSWREKPQDPATWAGVDRIPDADLWRVRQDARAEFLRYCAQQVAAGHTGGITPRLDPNVLTIGFARRFAGYKRATLLFRDRERMARILAGGGSDGGGRPVQLIISGKSHPGDTWGKHLIRDIVEFARSRHAQGRVLFIEDYSIGVAREMVRGCDVWLNNPIRGLEASGTSGMKAALNGVLNASILDGWWDEAYSPDLGYEIPAKGTYPSDAPDEARDNYEADELYRLLERNLIPDFYTRGPSGVPETWVKRMKRCISVLAPEFSTHRMVSEYATKYYFPAHAAASRRLSAAQAGAGDASANPRAIARQVARYRAHWSRLSIVEFALSPASPSAPCSFTASARVYLDGLDARELAVQVIHGEADDRGQIPTAHVVDLSPAKSEQNVVTCEAVVSVPGDCSPHYSMMLRVIPRDERLLTPFIPGLVLSSAAVRARDKMPHASPGAWGGTSNGAANGSTGGASVSAAPSTTS